MNQTLPPLPANADESEVRARLDVLRLQCRSVTVAAAQATGTPQQEPPLTNDLLADVRALELHIADMQTKIDGAPKTRSQASANAQAPATGAAKLNATQQVLARYGASSVDELGAKRPARNPRNYSLPSK